MPDDAPAAAFDDTRIAREAAPPPGLDVAPRPARGCEVLAALQ